MIMVILVKSICSYLVLIPLIKAAFTLYFLSPQRRGVNRPACWKTGVLPREISLCVNFAAMLSTVKKA